MRDLYGEVSARIVAELERGAAPWVKPWSATAGQNLPQNAVTNRPYSGCNVILLWLARNRGWSTPRFLTFKQAIETGGNVRKGEHGTKVYFVKQLQIKDGDGEEADTRLIPMRLDPSRQAEPIETGANLFHGFAHRAQYRWRQGGRSCDIAVHGVAFLSLESAPRAYRFKASNAAPSFFNIRRDIVVGRIQLSLSVTIVPHNKLDKSAAVIATPNHSNPTVASYAQTRVIRHALCGGEMDALPCASRHALYGMAALPRAKVCVSCARVFLLDPPPPHRRSRGRSGGFAY
jgi:hypothetical protein